MKRKNLMTAFMCAFCLTVSSVAPMVVMAEEATEEAADGSVEDSAAEDEDGAVEDGAAEAETDDESGTEETELIRPDYTASDHVDLGEYKGLTVTLTKDMEAQVDAQVDQNIQAGGLTESIEEGTVQEGDTVNIDYEGKLNGEAFDGGTAKGYDLTIGSHTFIDGFEEGLVGVGLGDTVDLPLTFPENYGVEELDGQEVVFTVTVNEIKRAPELTDEMADTLSNGKYTNVESYRGSIRNDLIKYQLLLQVAERSKINDYPQEIVDYGTTLKESYYTDIASMYEMELEDLLIAVNGQTLEEFRKEAAEEVKENMQQELLLKAIAEAEGIELSEDEYAAGCEEYASIYGLESTEELEATYGEETIRISLLQEKVLDFLLENAVIEEETEAESETGDEAGLEAADAAEAESEGAAETESEDAAETESEAAAEAESEDASEAES